ncbi:DUF2298 domain-containing protein [Blautia sp.]|jgi:uncharacterized membrane protein|uniref:DUF2298 domain-containing protein n=1 Tax=Blautia sp. TaxID=1955243 RepID=UPI002A765C25|nr:DUF2298 domain-containing protein [Blautia sp.]MDY3016245.1 DUF2298 domain-containing protein [Blautia sp.]
MRSNKIKKMILKLLPAGVLLGMAVWLLKGDVWTFLTWWLLAGVMGMAAMPLTGLLFREFDDKGWMFSKIVAIVVTGFLTWFLTAVKLLKFTTSACVGVSLACGLLFLLLGKAQYKKGIECLPINHLELVYWEEVLFLAFFLLWTYLAGFHPAAYGTEKFMDYGFMEAMMRSTTLPAVDLWYSEGTINYYYGGQYFAVFLTKLTGTKVELTYNLMRTFVAGLAFVLPYSLVYQMAKDRMGKKAAGAVGWKKAVPQISGILAGLSVSIAGNMHYVYYGQIRPWLQKLTGQEPDSYWFPDATRYIGFNPDVEDKTIHEFPCYSFVLGDLHAHVVNIMFVLLLLGLLYAWVKMVRKRTYDTGEPGTKEFWEKHLLMPQILFAAVLLGMFRWTNYWDFVIYFVVTGGVVLFTNIVLMKGQGKWVIGVTAAQAAEVLAIGTIVILPFTLNFETMVQGVAVAQNHSLPHQLLILWGLPVILTVIFVISLLAEKLGGVKNKTIYKFMKSLKLPDLFAMVMGLCAIGLVLIPELVYVRDIYENGNARANTMFKLTYQAYIMFGMTMAYIIFRMLVISYRKFLKAAAGIALVCLIWTFGYFGNSVDSWFGEVKDPSKYQGLNATAFLETDFPEDAAGIRWLKKNIKGSPVVLEANGDSYTQYERVSAMTGLPTVLGWYVHEWLWRNDVADLNTKSGDIELIYTSKDEKQVKELLEKYNISYIFTGACEREKYGENLNNDLLSGLGETVFRDLNSGTYIVKIK